MLELSSVFGVRPECWLLCFQLFSDSMTVCLMLETFRLCFGDCFSTVLPGYLDFSLTPGICRVRFRPDFHCLFVNRFPLAAFAIGFCFYNSFQHFLFRFPHSRPVYCFSLCHLLWMLLAEDHMQVSELFQLMDAFCDYCSE